MTVAWKEAELAALSSIVCRFRLGSVRGSDVLAVAFVGGYRSGSKGNPDARYITAMASAGVEAWTPDGLLLELTHLTYASGDMIEGLFDTGVAWELPLVAVVGAGCRPALESLLGAARSGELLFDTESDALAALNVKILARRFPRPKKVSQE